MGNKLKAISKISVALALLGAAVPAVEAAPTAMAAKKATKKAKKSTKKAAKKSTKKAKKAKKTTKKKATKKIAKKPAKKSVKKAVKKPVAKKSVKKAVKKPVAKKPVKKAVKKPVAKKPAKKVIKRVTMADKYQPTVKSGTVNIKWGAYFDDDDNSPENFITNKSSLPEDVDFVYLDPVNTEKGGTYKTRIQAKYEDGSREVVGTVTFVVPMMDADKYQPTVKDVTLNWGESFDPRKNAITNAPGYFPNDPALSQFENDIDRTSFDYDADIYFNIYRPGTYNAQIKVGYPDGSYEKTNKFKITVLPSYADEAKVSLKSSNFTVSSNETLEHETVDGDLTLNDPTRFLNIGSALPEGTVIRFYDSSLDSVDTPEPGKQYRASLTIDFPDGSHYYTDDFTVNAK
ncbi:Rib/alpha-like domain-containing protein [Lactobacillus delbrueckii subsp. allosunkii]|uniref:Rib/alpha-like domain-containing protein n=1 Tax=Lactobacillus delbrueckii TaxID=1584 RepID=UPI003A8A50C9